MPRKRKNISARTRFEIFKRDYFTCQYCGRKPPAIILHVDHIVPVAQGGGHENENLTTSCQDCNLGKSDVALSSVVEPIKDRIAIERERMLQMEQYNSWLTEIKQAKDHDFRLVSDAIISAEGGDWANFEIAGQRAATVRMLLKRLPRVEIIEAVEIADSRISFKDSPYKAFKYFCGICWRKVDAIEGRD